MGAAVHDGGDLLHLQVGFDGLNGYVEAGGELDIHTAGRLLATIDQLCTRDLQRVDLDASELSFVDSAGLRALVLARDRAELLGIELHVVSPSPELDKVLVMTGLQQELL